MLQYVLPLSLPDDLDNNINQIIYVKPKPLRKHDFSDDLFYNIALLLDQAPRKTNILLMAITIRINYHTLQCMVSFLDVTTNLPTLEEFWGLKWAS